MFKFPFVALNLAVCSSLALGNLSLPARAQQWLPVRGGITFGISGIALLEQQEDALSLLVVHDNKGDNTQGRLAIISRTSQDTPQYFPLDWPAVEDLPIDLEALTVVPQQGNFMAATSSGQIYHFSLDAAQRQVTLLRVFSLPNIPAGSNFESFALQEIAGQLLAVWGHRGKDEQPAVVYWGLLDLNSSEITLQGSSTLAVPWPEGNLRHISDLKVDSAGILYISAATDSGNDGPFQSGVYVAGAFHWQDQEVKFKPNSALFPLYRFNYHKVEAIELIPGATGGIIVGTDDENRGSSLLDFRF